MVTGVEVGARESVGGLLAQQAGLLSKFHELLQSGFMQYTCPDAKHTGTGGTYLWKEHLCLVCEPLHVLVCGPDRRAEKAGCCDRMPIVIPTSARTVMT